MVSSMGTRAITLHLALQNLLRKASEPPIVRYGRPLFRHGSLDHVYPTLLESVHPYVRHPRRVEVLWEVYVSHEEPQVVYRHHSLYPSLVGKLLA